jgi:pimeloyl-ACP methyl ester carboxylesterase
LKGSKIFAEKVRGAKVKIIEHCGHVCSIEKANLFNKFALQYLAA